MTLRGRTIDLGMAALIAAQVVAAFVLAPAGERVLLPGGSPLGGTCWFHAVFHLDCPFCGMTRSFVALAHGHLVAALRFHPAGPLLFVAMVAFLIAVAIVSIRRARPLFMRRRFVLAVDAIALLCVAIGVVKMVRS